MQWGQKGPSFFRLAQLCTVLPRTNHLSPQSVLESELSHFNCRHMPHNNNGDLLENFMYNKPGYERRNQ